MAAGEVVEVAATEVVELAVAEQEEQAGVEEAIREAVALRPVVVARTAVGRLLGSAASPTMGCTQITAMRGRSSPPFRPMRLTTSRSCMSSPTAPADSSF